MPNNNPAAAARSTLAKARSEIAFGLRADNNPDLYRAAGPQASTIGGQVLAKLAEADALLAELG